MNQAPARPSRPHPFRSLWPLLLPLLLTVFIYRGVGGFDFVNYDDNLYVYENPRVTGGLSAAAVGWALTTGHAQVWIPATWLSFQLDAALFGPGPAGFHRSNVLLHLVSVGLVWLLGWRLAGSRAAATAAAALWGVHPVNVEAVAWVTARKDVLMGTFLFGSVLAWVSLTGRARWLAAGVLAVLAMLAKPAAVVLPLLLLLATLWRDGNDPLPPGTSSGPSRRRWIADLPFLAVLLAIAAAVAVVTVRLARGCERGTLPTVAPDQRLWEAVTGVGRYLARLAWPHDLAVRYPAADLRTNAVTAVVLGLALLGLTTALLRWRRRLPLVAFAWGWFLVCLLPSSGLVQGGQLPMGDRYVYIGAVGLWIAGAAALARAVAGRATARWPVLGLVSAVVVAASMATARQAEVWRGSEALWRHALAVTHDNDVAHQGLAVLLDELGRPEEALAHLESALAIRPHSETHFNAGNVCAELGRAAAAEEHYRTALKLNPSLHAASLNLGSLLGTNGRLAEAREVLLAAESKQPQLAPIQYNLAVVAWLQGDAAEAATRCRRALELEPAHAGARDLLAKIAATAGPAR